MKHRWIANLDMYRKVPIDLLEGSKQGSIISWIALLVMLTLFFLETREFLSNGMETILALDDNNNNNNNNNKFLRVNFNITMMDLKCDYATINIVSVFGGKQHPHNTNNNVMTQQQQQQRQFVSKFTVDSNQMRQQYMHRNMQQDDIELHDTSITSSLDEIISDKERQDAIDLTPEELTVAIRGHMFVFVDMFAAWCSHCQVLAPTWEKLAEVVYDATHDHIVNEHPEHVQYSPDEFQSALNVHLPVLIAKLDCVKYHDFCIEQGIMGYPTLRLFVNGSRESDYNGDRTLLAMTQFLKYAEERHAKEYEDRIAMHHTNGILDVKYNISNEDVDLVFRREKERHNTMSVWNPDNHPGCMLTGYLMMDRAPGHFYIEAQSKSQGLAPHMTNLSHTINHLSFGDEKATKYMTDIIQEQKGIVFPLHFQKSIQPLDGNVYITYELHESYHHYIKLVGTNIYSYQVVPSTQLAKYRSDAIPEAKFIVDLSPISVTYRGTQRRWYDYVTSLMAIIGGTFTVVGMLEAGLRRATRIRQHQHHHPPQPTYTGLK